MMKTDRQIKRDEVAAIAYKIYQECLDKGMTNQQAIDTARFNKKVRVSDRTMRNYIILMESGSNE